MSCVKTRGKQLLSISAYLSKIKIYFSPTDTRTLIFQLSSCEENIFSTVYFNPFVNFVICHPLANLGLGIKSYPVSCFFMYRSFKLKVTLQSYIMTFCQVINKNNAIRAKWHNCNNCNSKWDYFVKITETKMMQLFQVIQRCFRKDASLRSRLCCFRTKKIYKMYKLR